MGPSDKFVKKFMRLAKLVGEDQNPCHSRQIGTVIVDPATNKILGTGYNGPPAGTSHCDTNDYLQNCFWQQLTAEEERTAARNAARHSLKLRPEDPLPPDLEAQACGDVWSRFALFIRNAVNKPVCPRRWINAGAGVRSELCACLHSECNAVMNASCDLAGAWMFAWCALPCWDCSKLIVQKKISLLHCLANDGPDYSPGSRWMLAAGGVEVVERPPEEYLA